MIALNVSLFRIKRSMMKQVLAMYLEEEAMLLVAAYLSYRL